MKVRTLLKKVLVPREIEEHVDRMNKPVGSFGYDPWGFQIDSAKISLSIMKRVYDHYFRVKAEGLENIPSKGRLMLVPNHSGQLPIDGILIGTALATNPHGPRVPRAMIERFFPSIPFVGNILNQFGGVIGDPVNCARMLENDESIIIFPEGVRGSGKTWRHRYQLQRFGNGFMHLAIQYKSPIIPVGVVGCEETIPSLANIKPLANLMGIPYVPLSLPAVLPAKVYLNFGKPMFFEGDIDSEQWVTEKVEEVKDEIRALIEKGLSMRKGWFR